MIRETLYGKPAFIPVRINPKTKRAEIYLLATAVHQKPHLASRIKEGTPDAG